MQNGQVAYLIEQQLSNRPCFFGLCVANPEYVTWNADVEKALKFADRESAEQFKAAHASIFDGDCKITEHMWSD